MAISATLILFIVIFVPVSLFAQTVEPCGGPERNVITVVAHKHDQPPALSLIPWTANQKPCKSPVAESVTEKPSWQVLKAEKAVEIDLDAGGRIVALQIVKKSVVPFNVKEAARMQGLNVE